MECGTECSTLPVPHLTSGAHPANACTPSLLNGLVHAEATHGTPKATLAVHQGRGGRLLEHLGRDVAIADTVTQLCHVQVWEVGGGEEGQVAI